MHSVTTISHTAETDTGSLSRLHSHPQTFYTGGGIFAILTPPHPFKKKKSKIGYGAENFQFCTIMRLDPSRYTLSINNNYRRTFFR